MDAPRVDVLTVPRGALVVITGMTFGEAEAIEHIRDEIQRIVGHDMFLLMMADAGDVNVIPLADAIQMLERRLGGPEPEEEPVAENYSCFRCNAPIYESSNRVMFHDIGTAAHTGCIGGMLGGDWRSLVLNAGAEIIEP